MRVRFALLLGMFPALSAAQQAPSIEELLPRLYAYASEYRAKLPSLSCDESITSQLVVDGKIAKETRIEATLREIRDDSKSDPFIEHHTFNKVDGRPPKPNFKFLFLVQGGFANLVGFSRKDAAACFDYHLASQNDGATLRLDMALKPDSSANPHCNDIPAGFRKTVLVDAETGHITHVERTISADAAKNPKEVYFASIDYSPQKLGNDTFWLPARIYAHDLTGEMRMFAVYSNFHRYAGEMKILPDEKLADKNE
jgi:hypothetical protein